MQDCEDKSNNKYKRQKKHFANLLTDESERNFKLSPYKRFSKRLIYREMNIMTTIL